MNYQEEKKAANACKEQYLAGLEALIAKRQQEAAAARADWCKDILHQPEVYRDELKKMLGWPLWGGERTAPPAVKCELLSREEGYTLDRMQLEVLEGVVISGLLFRRDTDQKLPLVLVQHGGLGTPELIGGLFGSTANYNDMLGRTLQRGVHVFAPQLLLWADEYEVPFDRKAIDARLKRVGSSITAVEVFALMRILDHFEKEPYVSCFGMVGLSYGGFYTLFTTAVDTRIKAAVSCSFFNTRDEITWSDWTWFDAARRFDDAEVASLIYPRPLCIAIGQRDELFVHGHGLASLARLKEICKDADTDWLDFLSFDGKHEFFRDDAPLEKLAAYLLALTN